MVSDIIKPGNKVELCMAQQIEQERKSGLSAHIYKSQVTDVFGNDELELSMPMEAGKLVMLPIGVRFELVFYGNGGLYRGLAMIRERYKTNNMHLLRVMLKSRLHKYQRREYYRMPCVIPMHFYDITMQHALHLPIERFEMFVELPEIGMTRKDASIVDISGGGVRFVTTTESKANSYVMIEVQLKSEEHKKTYLIPAHILSSVVSKQDKECFENRAEFVIKDRLVREEIIRYIFDEERKIRNKERERSSDAL